MIKVLVFIGGAICSFLLQANQQIPEGIEVSGKASVVARPDRFTLSFSIIERQQLAEKAKQLVDHKTDMVLAAAQQLLIPLTNIETAQLYLSPIYRQRKPSVAAIELPNKQINHQQANLFMTPQFHDSQESIGFQVSRNISITMSKIDDYDQLLDQLLKIGVTNIGNLQMSVSNADELYQRALQQAIKLAKQKAKQIAEQAGVSLGKVVYLKEQSYYAPAQQMMRRTQLSVGVNNVHGSLPGSTNINAEILMRFAIVP